MKQFYHITFRSEFLYRDDEKLIFESRQDLKNWVKADIEDMMNYYNKPEYNRSGDYEYFDNEKKTKVKKVYKRLKTNVMYCDTKSGKTKNVGVVYSIEYLPTENYMEEKQDFGNYDLMSYWCSKISKKDLINYSGFKEIDR